MSLQYIYHLTRDLTKERDDARNERDVLMSQLIETRRQLAEVRGQLVNEQADCAMTCLMLTEAREALKAIRAACDVPFRPYLTDQIRVRNEAIEAIQKIIESVMSGGQ